MEPNGHTFLDKVLKIVKDTQDESQPLIEFKHPKELEEILDLDVTEGVNDQELESCVRQVLQHSVKTGRSTFRNQLYGGTDIYGLSGAWISEAFNTSQYTFEVAPAFTLIELKIIRHILQLFGMPEGDGIFSPGGSMSMFYGIVAARYKAFPEVKSKGMKGLPEMVLFTSEDSHYSIKKAAHWLGFGTESVKVIKTNQRGQILVPELDLAIQREKDEGRYPLFVNATAGTTVLGAIDDLVAVSDVCKKHNVWMHVDACWGGSLILSQKHRNKLDGIERADSISWNPHKMAGAPLQCSLLLVRARGLLHAANAAAAKYLFHQDKFYDVSYDTGDKSVQCGRKTRPVRTLSCIVISSISWNPHKMAGAPLQCSLLLVRARGLLHAANAAAAKYLFHQDKFYDVSYDTGDKSVQCGRKIDAFKLWMMWKARGDAGLSSLCDHTMDIARFCLQTVAKKPGYRLVCDDLQCPNVCFWYIPKFMRGRNEDEQWWEIMHKITPKIKELLTLSSQLMVAYCPVRQFRNFFRMAFTFHPVTQEKQVLDMLQAIEECGEMVTLAML